MLDISCAERSSSTGVWIQQGYEMNNGSYLKKFFTVGSISREIVENFVKEWKFGWVEHVELKQTHAHAFDLEGEFISLFIIDSDLPSLNLLNEHIVH